MKNERNLSLSRFLIRVGERLAFRPESEYSPGVPEEEETGRKTSSLQPYLVRVKNALSAAAEESLLLSAFCGMVRRAFSTRVRALSGAFFLCGILQIFSYFAGGRLPFYGGTENLIFGTAYLLIALLGVFVRGSVGEAVLSGGFYSLLLKPYFGVEVWQVPCKVKSDPTLILLLVGLAQGALSLWLGAARTALYTAVFIALIFILFRPEAGLSLCAIFLFILPKSWLLAAAIWTLAAYFIKCAVGKRSLIFSPADPVLLVALLPLLFSEAGSGMDFVLFFALYFSVSGLVRSTASVKRLIRSFTLGAFLWAGLFFAGTLCAEIFPDAAVSYPGLESVFFVEGTVQNGVLLAMLLPLALGFGATEKGPSAKLFSLFSAVFSVAALVFVRNGAVWLCAFAGVVIFFLFSYRRALLTFVMLGLGTISILQVLPLPLARQVLGFFGTGPSFFAEGENLGLFSYVFSHFGVIGAILAIVLCLFFLYECYRFAGEGTATGVHPAVLGGLCATLAFALSAFQPLPWDHRSLSLFMLLLALPRAAGRAAAREEVRLPY